MKLTRAQLSLLESISFHPNGRGFVRAHITYAPLRRLIAKQAIRKTKGKPNGGYAFFEITDAGRAALASDGKRGG